MSEDREAEPEAPDLGGFRFSVPAALTGVNDTERLAVAILTSGACRFGAGVLVHALDVGAVDLGLVRRGRCPLLEEHFVALDHLLGRIVTAEISGQLLKCLVEFAPGERADRWLGLLRAGWPLSLSAGATIRHAERVEGEIVRAVAWRLDEISITVAGRDPDAHARRLEDADDLAGMLARMAPPADDAGRQAARRVLQLGRWQAWARAAGAALEVELGLDAGRVCDPLEERVRVHCRELERDYRP